MTLDRPADDMHSRSHAVPFLCVAVGQCWTCACAARDFGKIQVVRGCKSLLVHIVVAGLGC